MEKEGSWIGLEEEEDEKEKGRRGKDGSLKKIGWRWREPS